MIYVIYVSFFCPAVMFLRFPSSSRRSPACLQKMRTWSFPFSMFCVHLPRLLLNCMTKRSPTSTKVSLSVFRSAFMLAKAAENKNNWSIFFYIPPVLVLLVFKCPTLSEFWRNKFVFAAWRKATDSTANISCWNEVLCIQWTTLSEYFTVTGQSYEIRMLDNRKIGELPEITGKMVKVRPARAVCICIHECGANTCQEYLQMNSSKFQSIIRVVFHDRRLQYTEHQQLEGWRWNRPGDRILDLGECRTLPMNSV